MGSPDRNSMTVLPASSILPCCVQICRSTLRLRLKSSLYRRMHWAVSPWSRLLARAQHRKYGWAAWYGQRRLMASHNAGLVPTSPCPRPSLIVLDPVHFLSSIVGTVSTHARVHARGHVRHAQLVPAYARHGPCMRPTSKVDSGNNCCHLAENCQLFGALIRGLEPKSLGKTRVRLWHVACSM